MTAPVDMWEGPYGPAQRFGYEVAHVARDHEDWRIGQTMFNVLYEMFPVLANTIRGTSKDPFYNDDNVEEFLLWLFEQPEMIGEEK